MFLDSSIQCPDKYAYLYVKTRNFPVYAKEHIKELGRKLDAKLLDFSVQLQPRLWYMGKIPSDNVKRYIFLHCLHERYKQSALHIMLGHKAFNEHQKLQHIAEKMAPQQWWKLYIEKYEKL